MNLDGQTIYIIGMGGIGANLYTALLKHFKYKSITNPDFKMSLALIDDDKIEYHNLNRCKFRLKEIGSSKTLMSKNEERIPNFNIKYYTQGIENNSYLYNIFPSPRNLNNTIIIDCTDRYFDNTLIQANGLNKIAYKLNYDGGMWMTVTKNPYAKNKKTKEYNLPIAELSQGNGYEIVPSLHVIPELLVNQFLFRLLNESELLKKDKTEQYVISAFDYINNTLNNFKI